MYITMHTFMLIFLQYVCNPKNITPHVYNTTDQDESIILTFNENGVSIHGYLFQLRRTSDTSLEAI